MVIPLNPFVPSVLFMLRRSRIDVSRPGKLFASPVGQAYMAKAPAGMFCGEEARFAILAQVSQFLEGV